jgi:hypothetical protein
MSVSIQSIYSAIRDIERNNGGKIDHVEAFLINDQDLHELLMANADLRLPLNTGNTGEIQIMGMKIIASRYTEPGVIFKILKNEKPFAMPPQGSYHKPPMTGMVPMIPPTTHILADPFVDNVKSASDKPKPEPEPRHSEKRRIQLD